MTQKTTPYQHRNLTISYLPCAFRRRKKIGSMTLPVSHTLNHVRVDIWWTVPQVTLAGHPCTKWKLSSMFRRAVVQLVHYYSFRLLSTKDISIFGHSFFFRFIEGAPFCHFAVSSTALLGVVHMVHLCRIRSGSTIMFPFLKRMTPKTLDLIARTSKHDSCLGVELGLLFVVVLLLRASLDPLI